MTDVKYPDLLDLLRQAAECIEAKVKLENVYHDEPPMPATEWDYCADQLAYEIRDAIAAASAVATRALRGAQKESGWIDLTDEDRERAFRSMPDMLEGFMKTWGWLHFAKAIEAACREKNQQGEAK